MKTSSIQSKGRELHHKCPHGEINENILLLMILLFRGVLVDESVVDRKLPHCKTTNAFRFFRQEVKREIRIAEKVYVRPELLKSNGNTNSIWKIINHCLPNREPLLTTVEDPVVQANRFNEFYVSVGETAEAKVKASR